MHAGTLPSALGFCKELLYLDLSGHSLSGSLPALPPAIQFLNLSSNTLRGSLPEFAVDAQLQYLDLSFNRYDNRARCGRGMALVCKRNCWLRYWQAPGCLLQQVVCLLPAVYCTCQPVSTQ